MQRWKEWNIIAFIWTCDEHQPSNVMHVCILLFVCECACILNEIKLSRNVVCGRIVFRHANLNNQPPSLPVCVIVEPTEKTTYMHQ